MGALNGGGLQLKTILGIFSAFFVFRMDIFYFKGTKDWGGMMDFVYVVLGISVLLSLLKISFLLDEIKQMIFKQNFYK